MAQIASLLVPGVNIPQPDNSWLGSIADSIGGAVQNVRADRSFNGLADRLQGGAAMPQQQPSGGFLSRLTGQTTAQPQMPRTTQSAGGRIDPSIRDGIVSTANSLGISPVDLATAISYETGGTFDPTKSGPTTQWGQHRGLIQFGEPQAQKYGVNWDDPIGSQLGENGAVANYLRDTGVKPGMGLMDIYSAINAGGVGRYDRSDANNGGAPGTVADKVNNQMKGHRARAEALFGGDSAALEANLGTPYQPSLTPQDPNAEARRQEAMKQIVGGQPSAIDAVTAMGEGGSLASAFSDGGRAPRAPMQVADSAGGGGLIAQGVTPVQPGTVDPSIIQYMLRDRNLRDVGLKLWAANVEGQKASEPWQFVTLPDGTLARANQQTGAIEAIGRFPKDPKAEGLGGSEAGLNLVYGQDADGNTVAFQPLKGGGLRQVEVPGGVKLTPGISSNDLGTTIVTRNSRTGQVIDTREKDVAGAAEQTADGKARSEAKAALPAIQSASNQMLATIDSLANDAYLPNMLGPINSRTPNLTSDAARVQSKMDQINGQTFLQAFNALKGGGAITEIEGQKATEAMARLNTAQSVEDYQAALAELRGVVERGLANAQAKATGATQPTAPSGNQTSSGVKWSIEE